MPYKICSLQVTCMRSSIVYRQVRWRGNREQNTTPRQAKIRFIQFVLKSALECFAKIGSSFAFYMLIMLTSRYKEQPYYFSAIYCLECFEDINNMCTVCMNPVDYGDFADVSEERYSISIYLPIYQYMYLSTYIHTCTYIHNTYIYNT